MFSAFSEARGGSLLRFQGSRPWSLGPKTLTEVRMSATMSGSFFDVELVPEGSYEVGPPYTEEARSASNQRPTRSQVMELMAWTP